MAWWTAGAEATGGGVAVGTAGQISLTGPPTPALPGQQQQQSLPSQQLLQGGGPGTAQGHGQVRASGLPLSLSAGCGPQGWVLST